jgi:Asp-tRNA(Asn)/Glu-tRNA(Gln) amidotransferase A subunit family amidase
VPVAFKDNYDVQGMATAAGSKALQNNFPPDNAFIIQRLVDEDAIVIGKTNMAEFACCASHSYSSMGGTVRNPYNRSLTTGGSSGGTAAALATSMALVGLGTDTGSSIRGPASHASLVGLRPTMGRTSRDGIVPLSLERDIGGPMARTVQDAALLFSVMAGSDDRDPITLEAPALPKTIALSEEALKGQGIGYISGLVEKSLNGDIGDPRVRTLFQQAISDLQGGGAGWSVWTMRQCAPPISKSTPATLSCMTSCMSWTTICIPQVSRSPMPACSIWPNPICMVPWSPIYSMGSNQIL